MAGTRKFGFPRSFQHSCSIFVLLKWGFFGVVTLATVANAVVCFQCTSSRPDGECVSDTEGMLNASKGIKANRKTYVKDCLASKLTGEWDRCFIERQFRDSNILVLFHRGCHTNVANYSNPHLRNLAANNYTSCEMRKSGKNILSCISFCQEDLCNGPQLPEVTPSPCLNDTEPCGAVSLRNERTPLTFISCMAVLVFFNLVIPVRS